MLYSILAAPVYIPTSSVQGFSFLHILTNIYYLCFLMIAVLTGVRRYLLVVLICISLMISDAERLFMCLLAICISCLEKRLLSSCAHFFNWVVCLFYVELYELFIYFGYRPLIGHIICKYFLPFCG